jgi:hypothetical protein
MLLLKKEYSNYFYSRIKVYVLVVVPLLNFLKLDLELLRLEA